MRTIFITLLLALTLTACGFFDDSVEEPMTAQNPEATQEEVASEDMAQPEIVASTNEVKDIPPEGLVGTLQLANGSTLEIVDLAKLGNYYVYVTGELNGRSSTVISFTRFQDMQQWEAIIFKDANNFIITTKDGKEFVFMNARLFIGSDSNQKFGFYTFNDNYEKVFIEVDKAEVATIKFQ